MIRVVWALALCALAACTDLGLVGRVCPAAGCQAGAQTLPDAGGAAGLVAIVPAADGGMPSATSTDAPLDAGSVVPAPDAGDCDPSAMDCKRCVTDWDCGNNPFYPVCDAASGTCAQCPDGADETALFLRVMRNCLTLVVPPCILTPVDKANNACWIEECGNHCGS